MVVIMRDAVMPECCKTCVCSEGYGCGITGTEMTTKEMESRPDWCPLEEVKPCEDAVSRKAIFNLIENWDCQMMDRDAFYMDIEDLPSVTPKAEQRWIPCYPSELPKNMPLWATFDNGDGYRYVETVFWDMTEWNTDVSNVIAYMPYEEPEPYREEGGE